MTDVAKQDRSFIRRRPVLALLILTGLVSLIFVVFPQIDLAVSRLFYVPGEGFVGEGSAFLKTVRDIGKDAVRVSVLAILLSLVVPLLFARVPFLLPPRAALFLLTTLAVGPGIIANGILKEHWGRARPRDIAEFGGNLEFSRAWEVVAQCETNCSFVSGEGSSAIWFLAFAMLVPLAFRLPATLVLFAFAAVMSMNRVAFGGHFVSDVLIGWMLMLLVIVIAYQFFYKGSLTDERVDAWFTRIREFLQAPVRLLMGRPR